LVCARVALRRNCWNLLIRADAVIEREGRSFVEEVRRPIQHLAFVHRSRSEHRLVVGIGRRIGREGSAGDPELCALSGTSKSDEADATTRGCVVDQASIYFVEARLPRSGRPVRQPISETTATVSAFLARRAHAIRSNSCCDFQAGLQMTAETDCLAEDAVESETVSAGKFPWYQGISSEFRRIQPSTATCISD
jgi:hypothetical protein